MFFFVVVSEANIYNILLVENEFSVHCCVIYDVYQINMMNKKKKITAFVRI